MTIATPTWMMSFEQKLVMSDQELRQKLLSEIGDIVSCPQSIPIKELIRLHETINGGIPVTTTHREKIE